MRRCIVTLALSAASTLSATANAHEVRPAYLELRQTSADTYDVLWKVPARGDMRLGIYVALPLHTEQMTEPRAVMADNAHIERWSVRISGGSGGEGLAGKEIRINGLQATRIDVLARIEHLNGAVQMVRVLPDNPAFIIESNPSAWKVASTYLALGIEHILLGVDHLLFVLALVLLVKGWRRLLGTITAFTISHSLTLALATLGVVHVPSAPVEACIALSIVFVAAEGVRGRLAKHGSRPGLTERAPWIVAFAFGLLHGLGFAGALSDVGLPGQAIPIALLFFNIGVEIGQLAFVLVVLGLFSIARKMPVPAPAWGWRVAPYSIGSVAMFWVIQRSAAF